MIDFLIDFLKDTRVHFKQTGILALISLLTYLAIRSNGTVTPFMAFNVVLIVFFSMLNWMRITIRMAAKDMKYMPLCLASLMYIVYGIGLALTLPTHTDMASVIASWCVPLGLMPFTINCFYGFYHGEVKLPFGSFTIYLSSKTGKPYAYQQTFSTVVEIHGIQGLPKHIADAYGMWQKGLTNCSASDRDRPGFLVERVDFYLENGVPLGDFTYRT